VGELSSGEEDGKVRASFYKALLFIGLAGAILASLPACGDGEGEGTVRIEAGPTIVIHVTPYPTVPVPEGPLPTRAVDFAAACQKSDQRQWEEMPPMIIDPDRSYTAVIRMEKGDITVELLPDVAPITVNNFVFLACNGFYDGLVFHFVDPTYVAITGDPSGQGTGGPGYSLPPELSDREFREGTVAMLSPGPSAPTYGSQFFICLEPQPDLKERYSVFGEVTAGLDVLEQFTPRDPRKEDVAPGEEILEITIQED
jgi:peptidylprolyl isomerase